MLTRIADLRLCALMSLYPYVCTLMSCALLSVPLCRVSLTTVARIIRQFEETGSLTPREKEGAGESAKLRQEMMPT